MKLNRLTINRLPGISQPYAIEALGAGFNVICGPNGIGKSSICRAFEGWYWEECGPSQRISLIGEFNLDGEAWWAEREGARVRWQRGDEDSALPSLSSSHHRSNVLLDWSSALKQLSIIEAELVALPRSLSNLAGDELEQIRLLQGQLDELSKRARSQEDQLKHADDARRDARLAAPLPSGELSA